MAQLMRDWIAPTADEAFSTAYRELQAQHTPGESFEGGRYSCHKEALVIKQPGGSGGRVQVIQVIGRDQRSDHFAVVLSDTHTRIRASISLPFTHLSLSVRDIEEQMLGAQLGLKEYCWAYYPNTPVDRRMRLIVNEHKIIGCQGEKTWGHPVAIEQQPCFRDVIPKMTKLFSQRPEEDEEIEIQSQAGDLEHPDRLSVETPSQPGFATQIPAKPVPAQAPSVEPVSLLALIQQAGALPKKTVDAHPLQEMSDSRRAEQSSRLEAKTNSQSSSNGSKETQSLYTQVLRDDDSEKENGRESLTPEALSIAAQLIDQARPLPEDEQLESHVLLVLTPESNPFLGMKRIPRSYVRIPKDQQVLLDQKESWYKPESTGRSYANVPANVLQDLQDHAQRLDNGHTEAEGIERDDSYDDSSVVDEVAGTNVEALVDMEDKRDSTQSTLARSVSSDEDVFSSWEQTDYGDIEPEEIDAVSPPSPPQVANPQGPMPTVSDDEPDLAIIAVSDKSSHSRPSPKIVYDYHSSSPDGEDEMELAVPYAIDDEVAVDDRATIADHEMSQEYPSTAMQAKPVIQVEQTPDHYAREINLQRNGRQPDPVHHPQYIQGLRSTNDVSSDPIIPATFQQTSSEDQISASRPAILTSSGIHNSSTFSGEKKLHGIRREARITDRNRADAENEMAEDQLHDKFQSSQVSAPLHIAPFEDRGVESSEIEVSATMSRQAKRENKISPADIQIRKERQRWQLKPHLSSQEDGNPRDIEKMARANRKSFHARWSSPVEESRIVQIAQSPARVKDSKQLSSSQNIEGDVLLQSSEEFVQPSVLQQLEGVDTSEHGVTLATTEAIVVEQSAAFGEDGLHEMNFSHGEISQGLVNQESIQLVQAGSKNWPSSNPSSFSEETPTSTEQLQPEAVSICSDSECETEASDEKEVGGEDGSQDLPLPTEHLVCPLVDDEEAMPMGTEHLQPDAVSVSSDSESEAEGLDEQELGGEDDLDEVPLPVEKLPTVLGDDEETQSWNVQGAPENEASPIPEESMQVHDQLSEDQGSLSPSCKQKFVFPHPTQPTAFGEFISNYPSYRGTKKKFLWALVYIEWLGQSNGENFLRVSLWDDFIRTLAAEFHEYVREAENIQLPLNKVKNGFAYFNRLDKPPVFNDQIITPDNLKACLLSHQDDAGDTIDEFRRKFNQQLSLEGPESSRATPSVASDLQTNTRKRKSLGCPSAALEPNVIPATKAPKHPRRVLKPPYFETPSQPPIATRQITSSTHTARKPEAQTPAGTDKKKRRPLPWQPSSASSNRLAIPVPSSPQTTTATTKPSHIRSKDYVPWEPRRARSSISRETARSTSVSSRGHAPILKPGSVQGTKASNIFTGSPASPILGSTDPVTKSFSADDSRAGTTNMSRTINFKFPAVPRQSPASHDDNGKVQGWLDQRQNPTSHQPPRPSLKQKRHSDLSSLEAHAGSDLKRRKTVHGTTVASSTGEPKKALSPFEIFLMRNKDKKSGEASSVRSTRITKKKNGQHLEPETQAWNS